VVALAALGEVLLFFEVSVVPMRTAS